MRVFVFFGIFLFFVMVAATKSAIRTPVEAVYCVLAATWFAIILETLLRFIVWVAA